MNISEGYCATYLVLKWRMVFCPTMKNGLGLLFRISVITMQRIILSYKANEAFCEHHFY
jgi:hypothetical protein